MILLDCKSNYQKQCYGLDDDTHIKLHYYFVFKKPTIGVINKISM